MPMTGFWDRLVASIEAKLNKLLDRFEDPREQLDYAYDKLVQQLHDVDMALARAMTARKKLEFNAERIREKVEDLDEKARRALELGREDLAKKALERKHVLQAELESLERKIEEMKEDEEKLKQVRETLQTRIELFRAKKEKLKAEYEVSKAQVEVKESLSGLSDDMLSAARAIERAESKVEDMRARAAAIDELVAAGGELDILEPEERDEIEKELKTLEIQKAVEDDLAKLKQELGRA